MWHMEDIKQHKEDSAVEEQQTLIISSFSFSYRLKPSYSISITSKKKS